jgi:hypothetical protein
MTRQTLHFYGDMKRHCHFGRFCSKPDFLIQIHLLRNNSFAFVQRPVKIIGPDF